MLLEYVQGMTNVERICQKNCINLAISQKIFTKLKKKNLNKLQKFSQVVLFYTTVPNQQRRNKTQATLAEK